MFKRKNKRTEWLATLLEIEQLYREGYVYSHVSESNIWFSKTEPGGINSKIAIYLGIFPIDNWWKVELVNEYKDHLRLLARLK